MLGVLVFTGAPARADSIAQIEAKINKQWQQLEPIIENYNSINAKYLSQKHRADVLQKQIQPLYLKVAVSEARVGSISAQIYEGGPTGGLAALLETSNTLNTLNVLGTIEQMARNQRVMVAGAVALMNKYQQQKKPIDELAASLKSQAATLAAQSKTIQASIASLDKLRIQAWGTTVKPGKTRPVACPQKYTGDAGSRAAQWACNQIGKSYVWGAAGPYHFDCSGLTMEAWASVGVSLPHNAYAQKHSVPAVHGYSNLRPGDLVFYYPSISHVTIYVGNGWVVSAPQTGDVVRMVRWNSSTDVRGFGRP
jgi:cell wall-associated NlpC family hydrolase